MKPQFLGCENWGGAVIVPPQRAAHLLRLLQSVGINAFSMYTVLASCSRRKRLPPASGLSAQSLPRKATAAIASEWNRRVRDADAETPARRLYCGRSFKEAEAAATAGDQGRLLIASAGLGLIQADDLIPSYALTVANGAPDSVLDHLTPKGSPQTWWTSFTAEAPHHSALATLLPPRGAIIVALPDAYMRMLEADLAALPGRQRKRLRIIPSRAELKLESTLQPQVMPYDERLEGAAGRAGARSDFVSRAARHFVEAILLAAPEANAADHARATTGALTGLSFRAVPARERRTDAEILDLIRTHWIAARGRTTVLLRILRDDLKFACEQGRFATLANQVRQEKVS